MRFIIFFSKFFLLSAFPMSINRNQERKEGKGGHLKVELKPQLIRPINYHQFFNFTDSAAHTNVCVYRTKERKRERRHTHFIKTLLHQYKFIYCTITVEPS